MRLVNIIHLFANFIGICYDYLLCYYTQTNINKLLLFLTVNFQ